MMWSKYCLVLLAVLVAVPAVCQGQQQESTEDSAPERISVVPVLEGLLTIFDDPAMADVVAEVLDRNPGIARARAEAAAAAAQAPQVRSLPNPVASVSAFLAPPETRTGPQRLMAGVSQEIPGWGRLELRERAALYSAAALGADVESQRLELITETRRLALEIAFLDRHEKITGTFRSHLLQHEEIARARYSTGSGLGQGVVKLQAAITSVDSLLVEIEMRKVGLIARINALRDQPASLSVPVVTLEGVGGIEPDIEDLVRIAFESRPEIAAADARIARAESWKELAERGKRPGFRFGFTYTLVDQRDDAAGRTQPPAGNGDDIFGVQAGFSLPVWRRGIVAGIEEATARLAAEREGRRDLIAGIRTEVGDLGRRLPLEWRRLRLAEDLLIVQAEEALGSAQAGYVSGALNALDVFDATHVLFDARTTAARSRADYLIGMVELEGAVGAPLYMKTLEH